MKLAIQNWLEQTWYQESNPPWLLRGLALIFKQIVCLRRYAYHKGLLKSVRLPVPVIIVGNLTVGGTGKSPLTLYLAELLTQAGYHPGIISRGYGGKSKHWPRLVTQASDPHEVGDEAVMIAQRALCPVAVGPVRSQVARMLITHHACNVIISDDGLQHYALARDIEIVVIDGARRFGNAYCLPAGPLREDVSRLAKVDFQIINGPTQQTKEYAMQVTAAAFAKHIISAKTQALQAFSAVYAVAGIGNPQRFFNLLQQVGIHYRPKIFPDHFAYQASDLEFDPKLPILMTEKDAVKCKNFANPDFWYLPVQAQLSPAFDHAFLTLLRDKFNGSQLT